MIFNHSFLLKCHVNFVMQTISKYKSVLSEMNKLGINVFAQDDIQIICPWVFPDRKITGNVVFCIFFDWGCVISTIMGICLEGFDFFFAFVTGNKLDRQKLKSVIYIRFVANYF